MTNTPPTPTDIIQAITAMRSHWHSVKREIADKKAEIAHNQGELADMEEKIARTGERDHGFRADFRTSVRGIQTAKTSRRTGASRVAVEECPSPWHGGRRWEKNTLPFTPLRRPRPTGWYIPEQRQVGSLKPSSCRTRLITPGSR